MTSVALVVLDTLRKDSFDEHFDWLPGRRFENTWSTSHWTVPVHASLFTGQYPSEAGVTANRESLDCPEPTIAELASESGHTTRGFSANGNISDHFEFDRGFDEFTENWRAEGWKDELQLEEQGDVFDWKRYNAETDHTGLKRQLVGTARCVFGDYDTIPSLRHGFRRKMRGPGSPTPGEAPMDFGSTEAIDFVDGRQFGDDELLFVNLMEAHNPYEVPEQFQTVDPVRIHGLTAFLHGPDADPDHIRQAYDDCARYLASQYRELFDRLDSSFDYVITLSDHGELLGEGGNWEHLCGIQPELTHVPLVISGLEGDDTDAAVSLLDVHATIADLLGIDADSRGRSLAGAVEGGEWLTEYHGLSSLHRQSLDDDDQQAVAFMETTLDGLAVADYYGHETFDGFDESGESPYDDPQSRLAALVDELDRRKGDREDYDDLSEERLQQLEDLGYA